MKKIALVLIFFGVFLILGIGLFLREKKFPIKNNQIPEKIVFFYGIGCPHCQKVEEFIKENKIKEKISFEEKEVYLNKENAKLLTEMAKKCGINENEIGVPFLWDGEKEKCIIGDEPIIEFFKEKLNL
jgi:glutaredoxin